MTSLAHRYWRLRWTLLIKVGASRAASCVKRLYQENTFRLRPTLRLVHTIGTLASPLHKHQLSRNLQSAQYRSVTEGKYLSQTKSARCPKRNRYRPNLHLSRHTKFSTKIGSATLGSHTRQDALHRSTWRISRCSN